MSHRGESRWGRELENGTPQMNVGLLPCRDRRPSQTQTCLTLPRGKAPCWAGARFEKR
jgi:hypothetical protein